MRNCEHCGNILKNNKSNMKKLKIFGYAWHIGHQASLINAFPEYNFYYIKNTIKHWNEESRPVPKNLFFVDHYEPGEYDLAILHVDQQCLYGDKKGIPYRMMNETIQDIPKIVINHGTPHFLDKDPEILKDEMRRLMGDNFMVVNSRQAWKEWGFGRYIIHGISPIDFKPAAKKENNIITSLSPCNDLSKDGWAEYYNRFFFRDVKEKIDILHIGQERKFSCYEEYRDFLSKSLIYFNPTKHSPMPRSRTEAMLSGCVVVSTASHDWGEYIINGKNGFIISGDNVNETVEILKWLRRNPKKAAQIGLEGRKTAMHFFSPERFRKDWEELIRFVLNNHIIGRETRELKNQIEDLVYLIPGAKNNIHWKNALERTLEVFSKKIKQL
jgi:glycosyltransferase involved in cell wall biosynthesis